MAVPADHGRMKISDSTPLPPPVVNHTRSGRPAAATPPETAPPSEAPAESGKANGLVRAAGGSRRSDVAALRQWINHPDLRVDLALPDLAAERKGNGFERAVAVYEAAIAIGPPPITTDSDPVTTDPAPVVSEPAPVVPEPLLDVLWSPRS